MNFKDCAGNKGCSSEEDCDHFQIDSYSYRSGAVLGRGCYGSVFEGINRITGSRVAIKVIDLKRVTSSLQKVLLQNEKSVIDLLIRHPITGVTEYEKIVESKTHIYIIMKLYKGQDLQKELKGKKLSEFTAKKYMLDILNAYIELRQIKIVHRDLKPANILIDQNGHLKITDFGFAVFQEQDTKTYGYSLGSPVYCSPESLLSHQYGIKSDIWALGIIAYKMLVNKTPWKARNTKELIEQMKSIPIKNLVDCIKDETLSKLICSFCDFDPEQRSGMTQLQQMRNLLQKETLEQFPFSPANSKQQDEAILREGLPFCLLSYQHSRKMADETSVDVGRSKAKQAKTNQISTN